MKQKKCNRCGAVTNGGTLCDKHAKLHLRATLAYQKRNARKGHCRFCSRKRFHGQKYCAVHMATRLFERRRRREECRKAGICCRCGMKLEPERVGMCSCGPCQRIRVAEHKRRRARRKEKGRCCECGAVLDEYLRMLGRARCDKCADYLSTRRRERRAREEQYANK